MALHKYKKVTYLSRTFFCARLKPLFAISKSHLISCQLSFVPCSVPAIVVLKADVLALLAKVATKVKQDRLCTYNLKLRRFDE